MPAPPLAPIVNMPITPPKKIELSGKEIRVCAQLYAFARLRFLIKLLVKPYFVWLDMNPKTSSLAGKSLKCHRYGKITKRSIRI